MQHIRRPLTLFLLATIVAGTFALAPNSHAHEKSWFARLFSLEHAPDSALAPSESFTLRGVDLETSCLIEKNQLMPLFKKHMGKAVNDATIVGFMRHIRSVLGQRGFTSIKVRHEASNRENGIVRLTVSATPPAAMADIARETCPKASILAQEKTVPNVKNVLIGGMLTLPPDAFLKQARAMQGEPFDAMGVINLMHDIRAEYTRKGEPLPYISFERDLVANGIIKLRVVEKKRRPKVVEFVSLEDGSHSNLEALPQPEVSTSTQNEITPNNE